MAFIDPAVWQKYKDTINEFHEDAFQDSFIWRRSAGGIDRFAEDNLNEIFTDITLTGLAQYNYFRSWPLTKTAETGNLDNENLTMLINNKYLLDLGYMNAEGYFDFTEEADQFIFRGIKYRSFGNTHVSQAGDEPLLTMLILKRDSKQT